MSSGDWIWTVMSQGDWQFTQGSMGDMNGLGSRNLPDECPGCPVEPTSEENHFIVHVLPRKLLISADTSAKLWHPLIKSWVKDLMGKLKKNELPWFVSSNMRDSSNGLVTKSASVVLEDIISSGIPFLRQPIST